MKAFLILSLASLMSCAGHRPGHGQMGHHAPGEMNKEFLSPTLDVEKWKQNFSGQERDVAKYQNEILQGLKLKAGERVADVGAGTGLFIPGLSKAVGPKGKVFAVEISPRFVEELKNLSKEKKLQNVEVVLGKMESTELKAASVNSVLVVDTYHHFDHPEKMLKDFHQALSSQGKLAIVDFNKTPEARPWIQHHIRLNKAEYIREIESNGFKFSHEVSIPMKENFMLIFQKTN